MTFPASSEAVPRHIHRGGTFRVMFILAMILCHLCKPPQPLPATPATRPKIRPLIPRPTSPPSVSHPERKAPGYRNRKSAVPPTQPTGVGIPGFLVQVFQHEIITVIMYTYVWLYVYMPAWGRSMSRRMTVVFHDDELYTDLKVAAVRRRLTASEIIAEAVTEWL